MMMMMLMPPQICKSNQESNGKIKTKEIEENLKT